MSHSCPNLKYVGLEDTEFFVPGIHKHKYIVKRLIQVSGEAREDSNLTMFIIEMLYESMRPLLSQ